MKTSIVTNTLKLALFAFVFIATADSARACSIPATHNYYLFSMLGRQDWSLTVNSQTMQNWCAYVGQKDFYWFDADVVRQAARKKGDALMVSYVDHLEKYLEVAQDVQNTWDYPTKDELLKRRQALLGIQKYAFSKTDTRLRSQHALLYMRCNMILDMHQTNVQFWEGTASKYINSVYRDMMRNIYAGALLKTGRADEATQIFIEQGDEASLYTYYYKKRSYAAIRDEYQRNPNSPAFPFLLQDFANNAQEATDDWPGKLFIRDINRQESQQMCQLADQVINEGKTQNPMLWKSLKAWLQYLQGEGAKAFTTINEAMRLKGTDQAKDNARVLHLFIRAATQRIDKSFDDLLAADLDWLEKKAAEARKGSDSYDNHYTYVFDRLVNQLLVDRYTAAGRPETAIALLGVYDEQPKVYYMKQRRQAKRHNEGDWNHDYSGEFFWHIDTTDISHVEKYFSFQHRQPATTLDKWLSARIRHDDNFMHELIGTKHLRQGQWTKAIAHLEKVSLDFINTMNIVPFMARRDFRIEPWVTRQRIKEELQMPGTISTRQNQKLQYAREMLSLEQGIGALNATARAQRSYLLAVRYAQASYAGDAWYLTRYGKSCMDSKRSDEADLLGKASQLLSAAQTLKNFSWREKALFGQAWLPIDAWYTEEWSDKKGAFVKVVHRNAHQYRALNELALFERKNAKLTSPYVSRCDVLKQFLKAQ